jgi:hypothetical protein
MRKNKAAQALGRLSKGKDKHYSAEEISKRTKRLLTWRRKYGNLAPKKAVEKDCAITL